RLPAAIALHVAWPMAIGVGALAWAMPSPSWPTLSSPQHHRRPPPRRPQLWSLPTAIADQSVSRPTRTLLGCAPVSPVPRSYLEFSPQHHIEPSMRIAQAWSKPVASAFHLSVSPAGKGSYTGKMPMHRWLVPPSPTTLQESSPQHHSVPSVLIAQV